MLTYTFEDIATVFAKKIRDHQPEGPYYIGGFCLSGVMAYEVARQFLAEGQEVRRLVLFYSLSPGYFASRASRTFNLYLQFELAKYHLGNLRRLHGREFSQYAKDRVQGLIEKLRPQMLQTGSTSEQFLPELEEVLRWHRPKAPAAIGPILVNLRGRPYSEAMARRKSTLLARRAGPMAASTPTAAATSR